MVTKKQIWNTLDQFEGKPRGSSYSNLQKERKRQGYSKTNGRKAKIIQNRRKPLITEEEFKGLNTLFNRRAL